MNELVYNLGTHYYVYRDISDRWVINSTGWYYDERGYPYKVTPGVCIPVDDPE